MGRVLAQDVYAKRQPTPFPSVSKKMAMLSEVSVLVSWYQHAHIGLGGLLACFALF